MTMAYRTPKDLEISIHDRLDKVAALYGIDVSGNKTFEDKVTFLIEVSAKINTIVLLVDEYDQPLISHINTLELARENQKGY